MKYSICQNRDALRRMKNAHIKRALLKRHQYGNRHGKQGEVQHG